MEDEITSFKGNYAFLSNYYHHTITYKGITYTNNEAAFQAQKCINEEDKLKFSSLEPNEAKRLGRKVKLRSDWEEVKFQIMYEICCEKFKDPKMEKLLLDTGDSILVEGNTWHDNIWGYCTCDRCRSSNIIGYNNLGQILSLIRLRKRMEMENKNEKC